LHPSSGWRPSAQNPGVRVSPNKSAIARGDCGNNGEKFLCLPPGWRCLCPALMFEMRLGTGQFMGRFALGAIAALFLVGCTTSPPTPSTTVNAQQIIYTIVTELYCATKEIPSATAEKKLQPGEQLTNQADIYFASLDNWVVGIDLYLSASVEASVSPSLSLLGPFNLAKAVPPGGTVGSFTSTFGGSFDQTRTNLREYKIYLFVPPLILGSQAQQYQAAHVDRTKPHVAPIQNWGDFTGANCDSSGGTYGRNSGNTYLVGRLGLKDWLQPAVYAQEASHQYSPLPKSGADPSNGTSGGSAQNPTIGETITFTIKMGGTLGPSFALTRVSGGSNTLFSATRTDNNYVNIVFTPATYCWTNILVANGVGTCPGVGSVYIPPVTGQRPFAAQRYRTPLVRTYSKFDQSRLQPTVDDIAAATARIDQALFNLNLAHAISP